MQLNPSQKNKNNIEGCKYILCEKLKRKWIIKHGKGHVLPFSDNEIKKIRVCFASLDEDGSQEIGLEELDGPLIGLGITEDREEIRRMIAAVDTDINGEISFEEFLTLINNSDSKDEISKVNQFFKDMCSGRIYSKHKDMSFPVLVLNIRRKHMLDSFLSQGKKKDYGKKILGNVAKSMACKEDRNPMNMSAFASLNPQTPPSRP